MTSSDAHRDVTAPYQAIVLLSFGGPEQPSDVIPFLENVTRGRDIPPDRLEEVAEHYYRFGGMSPINDLNRKLIDHLVGELKRRGITIPVYWGNRNWKPFLDSTIEDMSADGVTRALGLVTSAYSGYSSCRQYLDDIARAVDGAAGTMTIDKIRPFWNHPGFIEANVSHIRDALSQLETSNRPDASIVFTAHSIPLSSAATSDYEVQLRDAASLVMHELLASGDVAKPHFDLVYQSRSGPPHVPWLEPDISQHIRALAKAGKSVVVVSPIGFIADHLEVVYDLDTEARAVAEDLDITMVRASSAGTHPAFVAGLADLVEERLDPRIEPRSVGELGVRPMPCSSDCCPAPALRPTRRS